MLDMEHSADGWDVLQPVIVRYQGKVLRTFADLTIDGHRETWPVRSFRLRSWLRRKHYEATGAAATAGAISSALDLLEARAQFDAPQRAVYLRVAEHDGRIYLDLADERWRAVEIGADGWQVIVSPPVSECRPLQPPEPTRANRNRWRCFETARITPSKNSEAGAAGE